MLAGTPTRRRLIGGYQRGGKTPSVSYAATFGASTMSLDRLAINAE